MKADIDFVLMSQPRQNNVMYEARYAMRDTCWCTERIDTDLLTWQR